MKKGFFLIATMIFLGAIILVGYQNCGLTGAKKSHTKVTPVNPEAKTTPGVVDSTRLNATQAQAAGGTCNPATNVLRFSPQEPALRVNCAQLEELKTLIAPNVLTAEYFKSGGILMDTAGNIIQVSIVNPPATPKMVGSVPSQVTALQVVDAGLNKVSLTGGQNLAVVDLSKNFLREEPLLPNNPDVTLDENPVCDGATAAASCAKSASAPVEKGAAVPQECYTYKVGTVEKMYCEAEMTFNGVGNDYDVRGRINGEDLSQGCPSDVASGTFTEKFHFYTNKSNSVTVEAFKVRENSHHWCPDTIPNTSSNYIVSGPATVSVNPEPAFKVIDSSQSSVSGNVVTLNLTFAFDARNAFYRSQINVFCDRAQEAQSFYVPNVESFSQRFTFAANTVCTQPAFSVTSVGWGSTNILLEKTTIGTGTPPPPPPGETNVSFEANGATTCTVALGMPSCEVTYKYAVANIGTKSVGIYLNDIRQFCVPNLITTQVSLENPVLATANLTVGHSHKINAKVFDNSGCTGQGVTIGDDLDFSEVSCASGLQPATIPIAGSPTMTITICAAGTGTSTGTGTGTGNQNPSFSFSGESPRDCTVPSGKSFCTENINVSSNPAANLNSNQAVVVRVGGSNPNQTTDGLFYCLRNNERISNVQAGPGPDGASSSWIGLNDTPAVFTAYLVTGDGSASDCQRQGIAISGATLEINAKCDFGYSRNDSGVCALNSLGSTGAGTGTGSSNVSFAFEDAPNQKCTVPLGQSSCKDNASVRSTSPVSGLTGNQAIIIKAGAQVFGCIGNQRLDQSTIPSGQTLSWVGLDHSVEFTAYLATRKAGTTGNICDDVNHTLGDALSTLTMDAVCVENAAKDPSTGKCKCEAGYQNISGSCVATAN